MSDHQRTDSVSILEPHSYDGEALTYLRRNAPLIDKVSKLLGVPAEAIAGSIAREHTRADEDNFIHRFVRWFLFNIALLRSEREYEMGYAENIQLLKRDPGAMDKNPLVPYVSYSTRGDIGPGSIKVIVAMELVKKYSGTAEGRALGLDKYGPHDLKTIMEDLGDDKNPLTIVVAGLVVREGVKFFQGKSIAGIPWDDLSQEQKDAALTAYYTAGEHVVSVLMAKHEFLPFTKGPGGGQVGPWIMFGGNFANLQAISRLGLAKNLVRGDGLSVAPVKSHGRSARRSPAAGQHADASSEAEYAGRAGAVAPFLWLNPGFLASASAEGWRPEGGRPGALIDRTSTDDVRPGLAGTWSARSFRAGIAAIQRGSVPLAYEIERAGRRSVAPVSHGGNRAADGESGGGSVTMASARSASVSRVGSARFIADMLTHANDRLAYRSIAPAGFPGRRFVDQESVQRSEVGAHLASERVAEIERSSTSPDSAGFDENEFSKKLERILDRQARLPPSGVTGFDPKLSPAWAGLKMSF